MPAVRVRSAGPLAGPSVSGMRLGRACGSNPKTPAPIARAAEVLGRSRERSDSVYSTDFAFSEVLVRFEVKTRSLLSRFPARSCDSPATKIIRLSRCGRIGFGRSRTLFRRDSISSEPLACVLFSYSGFSAAASVGSASLQRLSDLSVLLRLVLESPARSMGRRSIRSSPRSNDRQPEADASHKVSFPFSVHTPCRAIRCSRQPDDPASALRPPV